MTTNIIKNDLERNKQDLINIAKDGTLANLYDLNAIMIKIAALSNEQVKYDTLVRRFFEREMGTLTISDGWFCHIIIHRYDEEKDDYYKDIDNSIKVFGCNSPKEAVLQALKELLKDEIEYSDN